MIEFRSRSLAIGAENPTLSKLLRDTYDARLPCRVASLPGPEFWRGLPLPSGLNCCFHVRFCLCDAESGHWQLFFTRVTRKKYFGAMISERIASLYSGESQREEGMSDLDSHWNL